jgi:hypothetical protein
VRQSMHVHYRYQPGVVDLYTREIGCHDQASPL